MSSLQISPEALAEFIHLNCSREYGMEVIDKLEIALIQRNITIETIYDVTETLNELQPMLNILQVIELVLDTALAIVSLASVISTKIVSCAGVVISGAHQIIKNNACNRKVKLVREAMVEDKRRREDLQALLCQQELQLSDEVIEFKAKKGIIHEVFSFISTYITGDTIDWIKHLENLGIVEIIPVAPSSTKKTPNKSSNQSKYSLTDIIKKIIEAITFLLGFVVKKLIKNFLQIFKAVVSLLYNCKNVFVNKCHPTAALLEKEFVPYLMEDTVIMQELLQRLIRHYRL